MLELFALFYGILGTTVSLKPYFDRLKSKLSVEAKYEKILFKCCRKAFKDVTGKDLSKFGLKGGVAVLQQIDEYFESDNVEATSNYIRKFFSKSNLDLKAIQERFRRHLAESKSLEVLTYVSLLTKEETGDIKRKVYEIDDKLAKITLSKKPAPPRGIPTPPAPYFAHPYPLQENFTGRLSEREELTEWFTKGEQPMFAYIAIGGMGKSALTWYWLHEDIIKNGLAPDGIIWWSFYDREASFDSFLRKAIQYTSKGEIDAKGIASTRERMDCLYHLLCNNQFLLVLDGVERVLRAYAGLGSPYQGDEVKKDEKDFRACIDPNVGTFLQWLASGKTKTLLTSRLCPRELDDIAGCVHKELTRMSKEDAVDFFHRQGVKGTRAEIETACEPYGYHPLCLRLLSGMIIQDPKFQGDIIGWTRHNPLPELTGTEREHHILELAYNSLHKKKQTLLSKLSAFRNPMEYDSILIFNKFETEKEFDEVLIELEERGLLLRDAESNKYDLHPIVRRYCYYDRLLDKKAVHSQLRDYFESVPKPEKIESLDDLAPVIELYHHTVNSERYDDAFELWADRIWVISYYRFGAYQIQIQLLSVLFPFPDNEFPSLTREAAQCKVLNELANSYSMSGQLKKAITTLEKAIELDKRLGGKNWKNVGLVNLARRQVALGDFKSAESNLRQSIKLSLKIKDESWGAVCYHELGRLLAYQGKFEESEKELAKSTKFWEKTYDKQGICIDESYRALLALFLSDAEEALNAAKRARKLADVEKLERDIICAEWLLGAVYLAKGDLKEAEEHLNEALVRDRKINMVELEPDILLELAKLRFKQGHKHEALKLTKEALGIADRCEYRLKQADIHNFLAEFYLDAKDLSKAKEHVEVAKERAECGYKPAMKKAEELLKRISQQIKQM